MAVGNVVKAGDPLRLSARGTLFIEHLEHLSPPGQRRLLAFAGAAERGAAGAWAGRLIAGSAMALEEEVAGGRFLSSLFDTLDKVRVHLGSAVEEPRDRVSSPGPPTRASRGGIDLIEAFQTQKMDGAVAADKGSSTRLRLRTEVMSGTWEALVSGEADLAIGTSSQPPGSSVACQVMGEQAWVFVVAPGHRWPTPPNP